MTWEPGRAEIERLLAVGHLERVPADPAEAAYLLDRARRHLATAERVADVDPEIGYDALYAGARKALTALLRQQGLRPSRAGGHEVVIEAAEAQLVPPLGALLRPYRRLRRQRNAGDYEASVGALSAADVRADLPAAAAILDAVCEVLAHLPVFTPRR